MVSPKNQRSFEKKMRHIGIEFNLLNTDVGKLITEEEESKTEVTARGFDDHEYVYNFKYFPRYQVMINYMKFLVKQSKHAKLITVGYSSENRPIYAVEINTCHTNPVFIIDAGIHAREWASHVSALYLIKKLIENENHYANDITFIIIPCLNPDGYEFSHKYDRFWRKSRSFLKNSKCKGVDLNRNFDIHWGEIRSSDEACSDTYSGDHAFSEPESKALRDLILKHKPIAYLTIHSYGPLLLYPYGYSKNLSPNHQILHEIARYTADKIKKFSGTNYTIGSSARVLYEASGGSDDWAMKEAYVPIVYTIELPEYNNGNFILPIKMIKPVVEEAFEGLKALLESIHNTCIN